MASKAKSKVSVFVGDGAGGMVPVEDRRFQQAWPISFEVPLPEVENWLVYLSEEGQRMGWSSSAMEQLEPRENSGSVTFRDSTGRAQVDVAWERMRDKPMKVRVGCSKGSEVLPAALTEFVHRVRADSSARVTRSFFRAWHLTYGGLPWKGELWLATGLRLAAPSKQYERALFGPRVVVVAAEFQAISDSHASSFFAVMQRELAVFLSVVAGKHFEVSRNGESGWTWIQGADGEMISDVRSLGYWESQLPRDMPVKGALPNVPLEPTVRPEFERGGLDEDSRELSMPADIVALWDKFDKLPLEKRRQFLQVASMWHAALSVWAQHETMRFALMVAACEALKPPDSRFKEHNIYHVVEALLGKPRVDALKKLQFSPQDVRSAYLHTGLLRGSEFVRHSFESSFKDPSFDQAGDLIFMTTKAAIVAWLEKDGEAEFARAKRPPIWRTWARRKNLVPGMVVLAIGAAAGFALSRICR